MLKEKRTDCESCINHTYDEDYDCYICERRLDEDEMLRYSFSKSVRCPFYQYNDEYINVRQQN